jgi:hypothetical protein
MNFFFEMAWTQIARGPENVTDKFLSPIEERVGQILINLVGERMDCQIPDWNFRHFTNRENFAGIIREKTA